VAKPAKKTKPAKKKASARTAHDSKKSASGEKAKKKLTPKRERFVAEVIRNGGNATQAAIAAGYAESSAYQRGHELVRNSEIQERIQRAKQRAGITPEIVTGVLAQQLLGDISDVLDDEGRFDYKLAKKRRATGQIQKLKIKKRDLFNAKGELAAVETIHELELYSSQSAAKILTGTMGMLKQPAVNPEDVARVKAEIDRLVAEGWSEDEAKEIVVEAEPRAAQWLH
jgi:phage terminase small subunit